MPWQNARHAGSGMGALPQKGSPGGSMAQRITLSKAHTAPYALLSTVLLGSAFFFAFLLWQGGTARDPYRGLSEYAPGFAVEADVVRVVRVVPLAGASLRSPIVRAGREYVAGMAQ